MTDRQTDGQTEFSSLDRICIACSTVKTGKNRGKTGKNSGVRISFYQ